MNDSLAPNSGGVFYLADGEPATAVFAVDLQKHSKMRDVLRPLGEAFDFPEWYGANLDALLDCLADPDWLDSGGTLRLYGLSSLVQNDPEGWADLLDVFQSACSAREEDGSAPLTILLDAEEAKLPPWTGP